MRENAWFRSEGDTAPDLWKMIYENPDAKYKIRFTFGSNKLTVIGEIHSASHGMYVESVVTQEYLFRRKDGSLNDSLLSVEMIEEPKEENVSIDPRITYSELGKEMKRRRDELETYQAVYLDGLYYVRNYRDGWTSGKFQKSTESMLSLGAVGVEGTKYEEDEDE